MSLENPLPDEVQEDTRRQLSRIDRHPDLFSRANLVALERIIELAEHYGFPVYLVNGPTYSGMWEDEKFKAFFHEIQAELERVTGGSSQVVLLPFGPEMTFPKDKMTYTDHVIKSGATKYTARVGALIKAAGWRRKLTKK